jgi:hypothetical protein
MPTYQVQKTLVQTRHSTEALANQRNFILLKGETWNEIDSEGRKTGRTKTGVNGQRVGDAIVGTRFVDLPFDPSISSPPLYATTNTYTTSGAIAPTDRVSLINAASAAAMTLAAGPSDGHGLLVKRVGTGAVTITASLDGTSSSIVADSTIIRESVMLAWSSGLGTWLIL